MSSCCSCASSSSSQTTTGATTTKASAAANETIAKSKLDRRHYATVTLENGLQVLLIQDEELDKCAASCDVAVGHMSDPPELPGLAHFAEHMVFLGTEKYEEENSFGEFLAAHNGSSNAYTSSEHTCFYYSVSPDKMREALDRFAQFFVAPLFTESATEREVNAVHSENAKNLLVDSRRASQLLKSLADDAHPYSKFGTGNRVTLKETPDECGTDTRKALLDFHARYYSASIMKLCIVSREPIDTLAQWARELFAGVPNLGIAPPHRQRIESGALPSGGPYPRQRLGRLLSVVPVKDLRSLRLLFPLRSLRAYYRSRPENYLSHLIGHEGRGSVLSLLKRRAWAGSLSTWCSEPASDFEVFRVHIGLTEEGDRCIEQVAAVVFDYIAMLRDVGPQRWIGDELATLSRADFLFAEKSGASSTARQFADRMHQYPPAELITGPALMDEWRPDVVTEIVEQTLVPENCIVMHLSQRHEPTANRTERWYNTAYRDEKIDDSILQRWSALHSSDTASSESNESNGDIREHSRAENLKELSLPAPNQFIASDFDILEGGEPSVPPPVVEVTPPALLIDAASMRLWHKLDRTFCLPKARLNMQLATRVAYATPRAAALTYLLVQVVEDQLTEFAYDADLAGVEFRLENPATGIGIKVHGYSEKLLVLARAVLAALFDAQPAEARFAVAKDRVERTYRNFARNQPYTLSSHGVLRCMSEPHWGIDDKLAAVEVCAADELRAFAADVVRDGVFEVLFVGNASERDAAQLADAVAELRAAAAGQSPPSAAAYPTRRFVCLPSAPSAHMYRAEAADDEKNSAIHYYCQVGTDAERRVEMLNDLFGQAIHEPCYDQLRTHEQLGYIVWSGPRWDFGVLGFKIVVQSSDYSPKHLSARIDAFLADFERKLIAMTDQEFDNHVQSLVDFHSEKDTKLADEARRHWSEIHQHTFEFDRIAKDIALLRSATKQELIEFFRAYIAPNGCRRRTLEVHVWSPLHRCGGETESDDDEQAAAEHEGNNDDDNDDDDDASAKQSKCLCSTMDDKHNVVVISDPSEFKRRSLLYPSRI
jgi:insulysin